MKFLQMNAKLKLTIIFSSLVLSLAIFIACQKTISNEDKSIELNGTISEFTNSNEFKRSITFFNDLGVIDKEKSFFEIVKVKGKEITVYKIFFLKNKKVSGFIEAIKVRPDIKNVIPNDDKFIMTLIKYNDTYDFKTSTGIIQMFDLNYDNFSYAQLSIKGSNFTTKQIFTLPVEISTKYSHLKKKKDIYKDINNTSNNVPNHFCDQNGNGNVGYFECVGCFLSSCWVTYECTGMCAIFGPYCGASMAVACVYLSLAY